MLNLSIEYNIDMKIVSPCQPHLSNANNTEVELDRTFFIRLEEILRTCPLDAIPTFFAMLRYFFLCLKDLRRGPRRGIPPDIPSRDPTIREILKHIPVQLWNLPRFRHCVGQFCANLVSENLTEAQIHAQSTGYYSLFHANLVGLFGRNLN
jgi:hypothetical protein